MGDSLWQAAQRVMDGLRVDREGPFCVLQRQWFRWRVIYVSRSDCCDVTYKPLAGPYWRKKTAQVALRMLSPSVNTY